MLLRGDQPLARQITDACGVAVFANLRRADLAQLTVAIGGWR